MEEKRKCFPIKCFKEVIFLFAIVFLILSGCQGELGENKTTLTINLGGNSRLVWPHEEITDIVDKIEYSGTLTNGVETIPFSAKGGTTVTLLISPQRWDINVKAAYENIPYAASSGKDWVEVKGGKTNAVTITMYPVSGQTEYSGRIAGWEGGARNIRGLLATNEEYVEAGKIGTISSSGNLSISLKNIDVNNLVSIHDLLDIDESATGTIKNVSKDVKGILFLPLIIMDDIPLVLSQGRDLGSDNMVTSFFIYVDRAIIAKGTYSFTQGGIPTTVTFNLNMPQGWSIFYMGRINYDVSETFEYTTIKPSGVNWIAEPFWEIG